MVNGYRTQLPNLIVASDNFDRLKHRATLQGGDYEMDQSSIVDGILERAVC